MAESRQLKCLLLPQTGMTIIVPSSAVAEVVTLDEVTRYDQAPDWFVGVTRWRGVDVPLVAFDRLCRARADAPPAAGRFVVLYALGDHPGFYGLRIEALPRNETVDDATLRPLNDGGVAVEKFVQMRATIDDRECAIPEFTTLERTIGDHMPMSP